MRILHVLDHSLPLHSGYTFRTAAILREQRQLGWETLQLTSPRQQLSNSDRPDREEADGWTFLRTPHKPGALSRLPVVGRYLDEMRSTARRIEQIASVERPDILHAHSPVLDALPALSVGRRLGIPVVYEVRACWEDAAVDHGSTSEGSVRYRATRALETYVVKRADAVTVICRGLQQEFESRGIGPSKITVIPNAVNASAFAFGTAPDSALRSELGLGGMTVLGFVGSFYAYEGLDLLLQAFARMLQRRPDLRVLLVGGGPHEQALKDLAQRLGVAGAVIFTGRVPHSMVQRYYQQIDLLTYPRRSMRLTELVTPLKPLEAMAQGRIFVASDVGGHKELVLDGDTGFLFAAGRVDALVDAVEGALDRQGEWDEMRRRARRFVETHRTWAQSVARYAPVYERLLAVPRGAQPARAAKGH